MPIVKVPVEHRFGVVSLNRAEELLQKQREKFPTKSIKKDSTSILTVAFIRKYNNCQETERVSLDAVIRRTLEHAKYKAGLNLTKHATAQNDDRVHMSIAEGWIELTMICQCGGAHQEEALLALSASLSLSLPSLCHLPALFYVAGLCLQWLKSDVTSGSVLRSAELLLLKILYKVSLRLYFHYIQGGMEEHPREIILQLKFDMEGFENKQSLYQHFPEALLHWRVSLEVGNLICTQNSGTRTFSSPAQTTLTTLTEHHDTTSTASHSLTPILWHALDVWQCVRLGSPLLNEAIEDLVTCSVNFATDQMLEGLLAMQFLCSAAELNLTVLSLLQSLAAGNAHQTFSKQSSPCSTPFSSKDHTTPSVKEAYSSPAHPNTLNVLGMQPAFKQPSAEYSTAEEEEDEEEFELEDDEVEEEEEDEKEEEEEDYSISRDLTSLSVGTQGLIENETIPDLLGSDSSQSNLASHADLSAIDSFELSGFKDISATGLPSSLSQQTVRQGISTKRVTLGSVIDMGEETIEENVESDVASRSSVDSSFDRVGLLDDRFEMFGVLKKKYKVAKSVTLTLPPRNVDSRCTHYTHSTAPLSGGMVVMGSQVPPSTVYRQSLLSSYHTIGTDRTGLSSSVATNNIHRFDTWPTEAALIYTISMASIIIYGRSSHIQKLALEGASTNTCSYGLKQLSSYDGNKILSSTGINHSSWAIRHCALLGLSRVAQICKKQTAKDGFSSVAWNKLVERQSAETDQRVLEAQKLQQASPNDEDLMLLLKCSDHLPSFPFISLMADSLAQMYLPTPSDPTPPPPPPPPPATRKSPSKPAIKAAVKKRPVSISKQSKLYQETAKPNKRQQGLCARADQTLRLIAEKHWRLQMEKEDAEELASS